MQRRGFPPYEHSEPYLDARGLRVRPQQQAQEICLRGEGRIGVAYPPLPRIATHTKYTHTHTYMTTNNTGVGM